MTPNGKMPNSITTRLESVQRSKGQSLGAVMAYCMGGKLRDQGGEIHDYSSKEGVEHVSMHGWRALPGETQEDAIQRFVLAAQEREKHPRAVEARSIRGDLPAEAGPELRRLLAETVGEKLHQDHGVAAFVCVHSAPEDGSGDNPHYHAPFSRRAVDDEMRFGRDLQVFRTRAGSSEYVRDFREWKGEVFNAHAEREGWDRRYTGLGYKPFFDTLNEKRAELGLEPLEVLEPTRHLGAAVMAQLRKRERGEEVEIKSELVEKNERIRAENQAKSARNEARISRDAGILQIRPRLAAYDQRLLLDHGIRAEMRAGRRPMGQITDAEQARMRELAEQMGSVTQLRADWQGLPDESRDFLGQTFCAAHEQLTGGLDGPALGRGGRGLE